MNDAKNQLQAVSIAIEFYREQGYDEAVLSALKKMFDEYLQTKLNYDELAVYFDEALQLNGVHYDNAKVYMIMMNALLKFKELSSAQNNSQ